MTGWLVRLTMTLTMTMTLIDSTLNLPTQITAALISLTLTRYDLNGDGDISPEEFLAAKVRVRVRARVRARVDIRIELKITGPRRPGGSRG